MTKRKAEAEVREPYWEILRAYACGAYTISELAARCRMTPEAMRALIDVLQMWLRQYKPLRLAFASSLPSGDLTVALGA